MQNITEICREFGVTVPDGKAAEFSKKITENYVTRAEHDKKIGKLETERDGWKEKAENAEKTLKDFEGIDPAQVQTELAAWKKKAEDAEKDYSQKIYERDFSDALKAEISEIKFTSEAAKKSVIAEIKEAGLKLKDGKILGLSDLISQMKKEDASAFVDEEQEKLDGEKARFTRPEGNNHKKTMTKDEIMNIRDSAERQKAIQENIGLFV